MSSITAESCVRAFLFSWVARFGFPSVLKSDQCTQFTSSIWTSVCQSLGISLSTTTSFHPQRNVIIKWLHRSLKTSLHACLAGLDWFVHLPLVLIGLWSAPKEDTGFSISEAVFGSPLTIPGEFLDGAELPPFKFLQKIELTVSGFASPPPHHVLPLLRFIMFLQHHPLIFPQPC